MPPIVFVFSVARTFLKESALATVGALATMRARRKLWVYLGTL